MEDSFLPQGYEMPKGGSDQFLKLEKDRTQKVRILGKAVVGYEIFDEDKKPHRQEKDFTAEQLANIKIKQGDKPKHFWAFPVYCYEMPNPYKVWVVTQKSIQKLIMDFYKDADFGDPKEYDLKVTRKGEGLTTEYTVLALNKAPLSQDKIDTFESMTLEMGALFIGEYPFKN